MWAILKRIARTTFRISRRPSHLCVIVQDCGQGRHFYSDETRCRTDGVHQVQVPWAREGSGFTLMMEALMMLTSAPDGRGTRCPGPGSLRRGAAPARGRSLQIEAIAMDMSTSYMKGATQYFPQASIVFDKFHVMVLAGEALDKVRLQLQREGAELKGAMWSLRGNAWNLTQNRQAQRKDLCRQYTQLGRAMSLPETLQAIYAGSDRQLAEAELQWWCGWAARSRLGPFRHLAQTVRQYMDGILAYFDTKLTSGAIEAVNGIIQLAKRMARGFKNFVYFRTVAYHRAGQLNLDVPNMS